ncbi:MAG: hypothetical protein WBW16_02450 [Bacteroidota bacterium]
MSHTITLDDLGFEPSRAEKTVYLILRFIVDFPTVILRMFLFVLAVRFINHLLRSIRASHLKARLTSSDREKITDIHTYLVRLLTQLEKYYTKLQRVELPKIFLLGGAVTQLGILVEDFRDLELAYSIFLEPVERKYTVAREYQILHNGRRNLFYSLPNQNPIVVGSPRVSGQMVFSEFQE